MGCSWSSVNTLTYGVLANPLLILVKYGVLASPEMKRGVPTLFIEIRGAKVHPSAAIFLLMKAMPRNCTIILRNTISNVQKSGNYKRVK